VFLLVLDECYQKEKMPEEQNCPYKGVKL